MYVQVTAEGSSGLSHHGSGLLASSSLVRPRAMDSSVQDNVYMLLVVNSEHGRYYMKSFTSHVIPASPFSVCPKEVDAGI